MSSIDKYKEIVQLDKFYRNLTKFNEIGQQNLWELALVIDYLKDRKFLSFVEFGVARGASFLVYVTNLLDKAKGKAVCFDINNFDEQRQVITHLRKEGFDVDFWHEDANKMTDMYLNESLELIHIDGWHDYEHVKLDFEKWYPKVKKGGVILLHDTMLHDGCIQLRKELEKEYNLKTFYAGNTEYAGIVSPGISLIIK